ncbi:metallophosphoesterase [Xylophilus sp. GOD-11R]|uniref:metallophosphoesterase n=1 Tax=Xylophilus sp. GOD-11R TaxID=3089814 RepID=UPI00298C1B57|nr:metallophosphoesterase [Xylophilus sp. GOD-11R]WPB57013.1 metallophosphoesterase [Xylophilus sp. GOD-11R]
MRLPLPFVSLLVHLYVGWRLLPALAADSPLACGLFALWLATSALLLPMALRPQGQRGGRTLKVAALVAMGLFSSLLVLTFLRDLLLLAGTVASLLVTGPGDRLNAFSRWSARLVPLAAIAITAFGAFNARRTAQVRRVDVPIAGLPAGFEGFTIAQLSDVHVGPTIRGPYVQALVDKVNTLGADLVAITGDLVDGSVPALSAHVAPLATLRSRHGSFFVTGNHEYYAGAHAWIDELQRIGIRVLLNGHVQIASADSQERPLVLAGVADFGAAHFDPGHRSDPVAALAGSPADPAARVLLAHQPRSAAAAQAAGFDLQISGHTHGGQFWPWNHFVRFQQPYVAGLHRLGKLWVYVSRGTGYWGPPKRIGAPSEITLLRLVRG